ncbi:MAG: hypothetical protein B7733_17625 [Myxococcales bacterium FL481]|nr:MAG: hypothetical protein B7733_17625 [Myxococcales bacterium FL481]
MRIGAERRGRRVGFGGALHYQLPVDVAAATPTVRLQLVLASVYGARVLKVGQTSRWPLLVPLVVGVESGAAHGRGRGLTRSWATWRPWLAAVGRVGVELPLTPSVSISAAAEGFVSLLRTTFVHRVETADGETVDADGLSLWRTPLAGARLRAGVSVRLP